MKRNLAIRILPMNKKTEYENKSYQIVQEELFQGSLVENGGKYPFYLKSKRIKAIPGTLVLFQYGGEIIASAELVDIIEFAPTLEVRFEGEYVFDTESIKILKPLRFEHFPMIESSVDRFSQAKHSIGIQHLDYIENLINSNQINH